MRASGGRVSQKTGGVLCTTGRTLVMPASDSWREIRCGRGFFETAFTAPLGIEGGDLQDDPSRVETHTERLRTASLLQMAKNASVAYHTTAPNIHQNRWGASIKHLQAGSTGGASQISRRRASSISFRGDEEDRRVTAKEQEQVDHHLRSCTRRNYAVTSTAVVVRDDGTGKEGTRCYAGGAVPAGSPLGFNV